MGPKVDREIPALRSFKVFCVEIATWALEASDVRKIVSSTSSVVITVPTIASLRILTPGTEMSLKSTSSQQEDVCSVIGNQIRDAFKRLSNGQRVQKAASMCNERKRFRA
mmetsp:Transcript_11561/g.19571  ORF Transcript_11561/g.19571 Transcript_11561/m.19571 type:complete len:110 (-) Transcript_11561:3-332(-)